jgi:alpha-galactosidase
MTKTHPLFTFQRAILTIALALGFAPLLAQTVTIPIETADNVIVLQTDSESRLRTIYFGEPLANESDYAAISSLTHLDDDNIGIHNAAYTPAGTWNLVEPAIQVKHGDGNAALELKYVTHKKERVDDNTSITSIQLRDPKYPFNVTLFYKVWKKENVIEQWTEIKHTEKKPVLLEKYASADLYFTNKDFYLTTYQGQWAKEMQPTETKLERGMRSIETKLGTRAMLLQSPNFILSFGQPAEEDKGLVMLGQLAWTGNFKLEFEVDPYENLRSFQASIHTLLSIHWPPIRLSKQLLSSMPFPTTAQAKPAATSIHGQGNTGCLTDKAIA